MEEKKKRQGEKHVELINTFEGRHVAECCPNRLQAIVAGGGIR